jgi:hypothetical protein
MHEKLVPVSNCEKKTGKNWKLYVYWGKTLPACSILRIKILIRTDFV